MAYILYDFVKPSHENNSKETKKSLAQMLSLVLILLLLVMWHVSEGIASFKY